MAKLKEQLVPIEGYGEVVKQNYLVSNFGYVWSKLNNKKLSPMISKGYGYVNLCSGSRETMQRAAVHRLVGQHFISNLKKKPFVCHHDDDRLNNRADNLFWGTGEDNMQDALKKGRMKTPFGCGEESVLSKLTEEDVRIIRSIYITTTITQAELAKRFGVAANTISNIITRKLWQHI